MKVSKTVVLIANVLSAISAIIYTPIALLGFGMSHVQPGDSRWMFLVILIYPASVYASIWFSRKYCKINQGNLAIWISIAPFLLVISVCAMFSIYLLRS